MFANSIIIACTMADNSSTQVNVLSTEQQQFVVTDETAPLLVKKTSSTWWSRCVLRYKTTRKCVSSKSALLILFWSFVLGLWNGVALNPDLYLRNFTTIYALAGYGFVAYVFCFFPLAGFLADVEYDRYKMVVRSLCLLLITIPLHVVAAGAITGSIFISDSLTRVFLLSIFSICGFIMICASYVGLVGFAANVVQFGMDQLHDCPGEDRILFIHWYVWVYFVTIIIGQLVWNLGLQFPYNFLNLTWCNITSFVLLSLIPLFVILLLIITLCLAKRRRNWFLIEPGTVNPYKLVYRVTKFARQHKTPVRRSAFTYCEDEIPTGLDLGKEKYGGPFSTEQVEDVKVFYGMLKVLFSFGAVFFLDFAASSVLPYYALHTNLYFQIEDSSLQLNGTLPEHILLNCGLLSPLLIAICLPLYLCFLRPFISRYVPGMLKRMGLGVALALLSLVTSFAMDIAAHMHPSGGNDFDLCMFQDPGVFDFLEDGYIYPFAVNLPQQSSSLLIVPLVLTSLSHMLIYTAVFEFICSQSPHSMKGLLIGLLYAIKGLYQLLATILVVPFAVGYSSHPDHPKVPNRFAQISCGFYYYLVNIVIGLIAVLTYMWVADKYKYCNRCVEEPNQRREQYCDYEHH